ncbi:MAG: lipid A deacylase LpxR family protein [Pseudomonadota bacterium]
MKALIVMGAAFVGVYAMCGDACAQDNSSAPVWAFTLENDWAGGSDKNYSGGWQVSRTAVLRKRPGRTKYLQLAVAQQFYTPQYDFALRPLPDQHPYAALLFGEGKLATDLGPGKPIDIISIQIGVIGPQAQGEEVQNFIHDLIGQRESRAWDNQIGDQVFGQIGFERRWTGVKGQAGRFAIDAVPSLGASVGNALMAAEAGMTFRIGSNLDRPLGEPRLEPSGGGIAWHEPSEKGQRVRYAYLGAVARGVGHKIWLDGRWGESDIVEQSSEPFVYDVQGGFVSDLPGDARLAISYMHRSSTFEMFGESQGIGAISIAKRF